MSENQTYEERVAELEAEVAQLRAIIAPCPVCRAEHGEGCDPPSCTGRTGRPFCLRCVALKSPHHPDCVWSGDDRSVDRG